MSKPRAKYSIGGISGGPYNLNNLDNSNFITNINPPQYVRQPIANTFYTDNKSINTFNPQPKTFIVSNPNTATITQRRQINQPLHYQQIPIVQPQVQQQIVAQPRKSQILEQFLVRDNKISIVNNNTQTHKAGSQEQVQEVIRPNYKQIHTSYYGENKNPAPQTDPVGTGNKCFSIWWILLGLLALAGIFLGLLFGLGIIGGSAKDASINPVLPNSSNLNYFGNYQYSIVTKTTTINIPKDKTIPASQKNDETDFKTQPSPNKKPDAQPTGFQDPPNTPIKPDTADPHVMDPIKVDPTKTQQNQPKAQLPTKTTVSNHYSLHRLSKN